MLLTIISLLLAALATGMPTSDPEPTCYSKDKFTLTISRPWPDNTTLPLHALDTGIPGNIYLAADPSSDKPGTPLCESGTSPNASVNVDLKDRAELSDQQGSFHLSVADLGELYGASTPVLGSKRYDWPHWYVGNSTIDPQRTSAAQLYFACEIEVQSVKYTVLSWGLMFSNGSNPAGCAYTNVKKRYDVPVPCGK